MVVGCGAVGVEFASVFRTFGSEVTLLEALPRVVPLEDEDISAELENSPQEKGIRIELEAKVDSVKKEAEGVTVTYKDKSGKSQTISAEKVLIAVGRRPLTENIGLEKTKAKLERGFVHTNAFLETDEPQPLRHRRHRRGTSAARARRFNGRHHRRGPHGRKEMQPFDRKRCPNATYCEPQIGSIGLTEKQAREAGFRR